MIRRKNQGKWKIVIFLSSLITLTVVSIAVQKICQDIFRFSLLKTWMIIVSTAGPLAVLILLHKYSQCIFMLTIPQIISKRGRMFFIATAFLIAFAGPTKNLIKNGEILGDSLSCSQVYISYF